MPRFGQRQAAPVRFSAVLVALWTLCLAVAAPAASQQLDLPPGTRIVRAWFDDLDVAARAVYSLDPLESDYEKGYIVLLATDEEIEAAERAGMRVVEDGDYASVALASEVPAAVVQGAIAGYPCYRTVEETYASAEAIVEQHPALATWSTIGTSWNKKQDGATGYDLKVLRLTNSATSGDKPTLFITAALHAREFTTAELALRLAEHVADAWETDADIRWLLDHHELHIMPVVNPTDASAPRARCTGGRTTTRTTVPTPGTPVAGRGSI